MIWSKRSKRTLWGMGLGLSLSLIFSASTLFIAKDFFDGLEHVSYDWRFLFKYRLENKQNYQKTNLIEGINIIDIDERSMAKLGNYHKWPRTYHGKVVKQLSQSGAATILFDIMFKSADFGQSQTDQIVSSLSKLHIPLDLEKAHALIKQEFNHDSMLIHDVSNAKGVIGAALLNKKDAYPNESDWKELATLKWHESLNPKSAAKFSSDKTQHLPSHPILDNVFPQFAQASTRIGLVNVVPDQDGIHRRLPLLYNYPDKNLVPPNSEIYTYPVLSLQASLYLMGKTLQDTKFEKGKYLNLGKPFRITKTHGILCASYPQLTPVMLKALWKDLPEVLAIDEKNPQVKTITNPIQFYKTLENILEIEILEGQVFEASSFGEFFSQSFSLADIYRHTQSEPWDWEKFRIQKSDENTLWIKLMNLQTEEEIHLDPYTYESLALEYPHQQVEKLKADQRYHHSSLLQFTWNQRNKSITSPYIVLTKEVLQEMNKVSYTTLQQFQEGTYLEFGSEIKIPINEKGEMLIGYEGPSGPNYTFRYFSYYDVLANRLDPIDFQGKTFILGSSAPSLFDIVASPFEETFPGIEIHATVMHNILTNHFLKKSSTFMNLLVLFSIALLIAILSLWLPLFWGLGVTLFISLIHVGITLYFFYEGTWLELVRPQIGIFTSFLSVVLVRYFIEEKEKRFINDAFKNYISPELIDMMIDNGTKPQLGGEEGILTALFTDIQGFSTFSEKLGSPTRLVELLNEYLSNMTEILLTEKGTLDKYEGDAIIAFFGAPLKMPDHARAACITAIEFQKRLDTLREKWKSEGNKWPQIVHEMRMRIGINSGPIVTGNMGSHIRMNYTMMGDTVNLAARLESGSKQYGVYILISKETLELAGEGFLVREIDKIRVVGKSQPVTVFELLGFQKDANSDIQKCLEWYAKGLNLYRLQSWKEASICFEESLKYEPFHPDRAVGCKTTPSAVFIERCYAFLTDRRIHVPSDWDGVYTANEK